MAREVAAKQEVGELQFCEWCVLQLRHWGWLQHEQTKAITQPDRQLRLSLFWTVVHINLPVWL